MKITIWDMDYYYNRNSKRKPDVMKLSSYYKQLGDSVNFVLTEDDINRFAEIIYVFKDNKDLPQPPASFFLDSRVRWDGKAYTMRKKWRMTDAMLACRPDYLLYPFRDIKEDRSEYIRLFNDKAELLPRIQDWSNSFKNKYAIVIDKNMWQSDLISLIQGLNMLTNVKNISFSEPIWIQKIISNNLIKDAFIKLNFIAGSNLEWTMVKINQLDDIIAFIRDFKKLHPTVDANKIIVDCREKNSDHWNNKQDALNEFQRTKELIIRCKREDFRIEVRMPANRFETPYFQLFEHLSMWTDKYFNLSWLEYITLKYAGRHCSYEHYWNHPEEWHEIFRDLLRQTYTDHDFLLSTMKNHKVSENKIPWKMWEEEFKYGL